MDPCYGCVVYSWLVQAELPLGEVPPVIELSGDKGEGSMVKAGAAANSRRRYLPFSMLIPMRRTSTMMPAKRSKPRILTSRNGSVAVINMAATWMPNFAIQMKLESKQKDYPTTTYVKDMEKILVEQWGLADDSNDVLIFDREGKWFSVSTGS